MYVHKFEIYVYKHNKLHRLSLKGHGEFEAKIGTARNVV